MRGRDGNKSKADCSSSYRHVTLQYRPLKTLLRVLYLSDDKGQKFTETGNFSSTPVVISHQSSEDIQTHTEYGSVPTARMTSCFKIAGHLEVISTMGEREGQGNQNTWEKT